MEELVIDVRAQVLLGRRVAEVVEGVDDLSVDDVVALEVDPVADVEEVAVAEAHQIAVHGQRVEVGHQPPHRPELPHVVDDPGVVQLPIEQRELPRRTRDLADRRDVPEGLLLVLPHAIEVIGDPGARLHPEPRRVARQVVVLIDDAVEDRLRPTLALLLLGRASAGSRAEDAREQIRGREAGDRDRVAALVPALDVADGRVAIVGVIGADMGLGGEDDAAVIKLYAEQNGIELP